MATIKELTSMHGNTFKVRDWTIHHQFPHLEDCISMGMDKDLKTGQRMVIIKASSGDYAAIQSENSYWILYALEFKKYDELKDIRKAHLHGNKYHA